jgi:hypothetical protein
MCGRRIGGTFAGRVTKFLDLVVIAVASSVWQPQARAQQPADIIIDGTWTYAEINNVLDNDPATFGKDGIPDPLPGSGEIIEFAGNTTYTIPPINNAKFINKIPGITIRGEDNLTTILRNDPQVSSGIIFENRAAGTQIKTFNFADSAFAFVNKTAEPTNPVVFQGNILKNIRERGVSQEKFEVIGDNTQPNIKAYDNLFDNVKHGMAEPRGTPYYGMQQPWIEARGNTATAITGRFKEPPIVFPDSLFDSGC